MGYHKAAFTLAFLAIILSSNAAFAQNLSVNQTLLQSAFTNARCKTNFTTAYISRVVSAAPSLSSLSQYSTTLQGYTSALSSLASAGNVTAFRSYVSGTYDPELNRIAKNVSSAVRAANLSANTIAGLRQGYNATLASYKACNIQSAKAYALQKLSLFNSSIMSYQKQANDLNSKGLNSSSLNQMLQLAQSQIVGPFASAINSASNASQISAALNEYCLFDGCKNGTNFHLAAHFGLQSLTIQLSYLEKEKNVSASSLVPASAFLTNASSILQAVGIKAYVNSQSNNIFGNLTSASKAMQQARKQDALNKLKQNAEKALSNYQSLISSYETSIGKLPSGFDTASLNLTISQAESQVVAPLQAAINSSTNATQLYGAFRGNCLENNCANGTNYHLAAKLKLEQSQAYLVYLMQKANASKYVTINRTALAAAESDLNSASSLIGTAGSSQYSQSQASQFANYISNFTAALKGAFTTSPSRIAAVNNVSVKARAVNRTVGPNAVTVKHGANTTDTTTIRSTVAPTATPKANITANSGITASTTVKPTATAAGNSLTSG
jgi:hypothetical protein